MNVHPKHKPGDGSNPSSDLTLVAPSRKIIHATVVALAVSIVIVFVAVLPAEYGIDPFGTGAALGLTQLTTGGEVGQAMDGAVVLPVYTPADGPFDADSAEITVPAGDGREYKYQMQEGESMVYSWTADTPLFFEFHGEPPDARDHSAA